jgi:GNAT superfamily N-acetyltransferase
VSRRAGLADLETLFAIQKESAVAGYAHVFPPERYPFPDDEVRESLRRQLGGPETIALLDENGRGFALVGGGRLHRLYVRPSAWGAGVGAILHDEALVALRDAGSEVASLWVLADNARARGFYERRGWRLNGAERPVPSPPNPLEVGYSLDLSGESRL